MQMIFSRIIPFLDVQTLAAGEAREILFRNPDDSFILYLADSTAASTTNERVIRLGMREALIWLNERPEDDGSFWI
jgi:hypothetical protein